MSDTDSTPTPPSATPKGLPCPRCCGNGQLAAVARRAGLPGVRGRRRSAESRHACRARPNYAPQIRLLRKTLVLALLRHVRRILAGYRRFPERCRHSWSCPLGGRPQAVLWLADRARAATRQPWLPPARTLTTCLPSLTRVAPKNGWPRRCRSPWHRVAELTRHQRIKTASAVSVIADKPPVRQRGPEPWWSACRPPWVPRCAASLPSPFPHSA